MPPEATKSKYGKKILHFDPVPPPGAWDVSEVWVGWLVVLRINVDLAIFQPYLDLETGDNQSLKIQLARPGMETWSSCSASQELNHSTTAACREVWGTNRWTYSPSLVTVPSRTKILGGFRLVYRRNPPMLGGFRVWDRRIRNFSKIRLTHRRIPPNSLEGIFHLGIYFPFVTLLGGFWKS